jgi:diaminopimelate epimerase
MMHFEKYHGTGNDFIIFGHEALKSLKTINPTELARKVCDRHFGIGADGMMIAKPSTQADIKMEFYNADGSLAPMCGNGIRCFAKYVYDHKLVEGTTFNVETLAGIMKVTLTNKGDHETLVTIDMGNPNFESAFGEKTIEVHGQTFHLNTLTMGTLHAVIQVESIDDIDISLYGKALESHSLFPQKINVNFLEVIDREHIKVSTFERGVGMTLSCGTGSAASVVVSALKGLTENRVQVKVPGGILCIDIKDEGVLMTGPATLICSGSYNYK